MISSFYGLAFRAFWRIIHTSHHPADSPNSVKDVYKGRVVVILKLFDPMKICDCDLWLWLGVGVQATLFFFYKITWWPCTSVMCVSLLPPHVLVISQRPLFAKGRCDNKAWEKDLILHVQNWKEEIDACIIHLLNTYIMLANLASYKIHTTTQENSTSPLPAKD